MIKFNINKRMPYNARRNLYNFTPLRIFNEKMCNLSCQSTPSCVDKEKYATNEYSFCFVISSYNNERNIYKNLQSVINQTYTNWRAIYINDCSTDNTERLFFEITKNVSKKFTYIKNDKQMHQMYNKFHAYKLVADFEIVCILDGDDWLAHNNVLQKLYSVYKGGNYKVVTSNYTVFENGQLKPHVETNNCYTIDELKQVRYVDRWAYRHLKTGYGILFKSIPERYVKFNGDWLNVCTDSAEMYCVTELANGNVKQINDVLYVYNKDNSIQYANSFYNQQSRVRRVAITQHLKGFTQISYSFPRTIIIHMQHETRKKMLMHKQMNIVEHDNFSFLDGVDGSKQSILITDDPLKLPDNINHCANYKSKYNFNKQHITPGSYGLLCSAFKLLQGFVNDDTTKSVLILEDDVFALKDWKQHMYINSELTDNWDLLYLGCHISNGNIFKQMNNHEDACVNINNVSELIYGTYAMVMSKSLAAYILSIGIDNVVKLNLSWDLLLNFIRQHSKNDFKFGVYYKELFIPNVMKPGINGIRNESFYTRKGMDLTKYHVII